MGYSDDGWDHQIKKGTIVTFRWAPNVFALAKRGDGSQFTNLQLYEKDGEAQMKWKDDAIPINALTEEEQKGFIQLEVTDDKKIDIPGNFQAQVRIVH